MIKERYARWMYDWETRLTTRDENRVVRPLEWGFEWIEPFLEAHGFGASVPRPEDVSDATAAEVAMVAHQPTADPAQRCFLWIRTAHGFPAGRAAS